MGGCKEPGTTERLSLSLSLGHTEDKNPLASAGDMGSIPGLGRSPGEGKGYPLHYSGLENFMDCVVQGVTESRTRLSDFHSLTHLGFYHVERQRDRVVGMFSVFTLNI